MTKVAIIGLSGKSLFMEVDDFHKKGETVKAKSLHIEPGGKGYNQAIACKRLGSEVSYLTCVGNDNDGHECEQYMQKEGVKTFFIYKDVTPLATILTNAQGENEVTVYQDEKSTLTVADLDIFYDEIKNSDILLIQEEIPFEVLKEALKYAYDNNVYTILNPAPSVYNINSLLPYINLLIPNETEAQAIFGADFKEIEARKQDVIITLGDKGAIVYTKEKIEKIASHKVRVVDTTGAGDVFCASIAMFIKEKGIIEATRIANTIASLHVQKKYVMNAIPTLDDVENLI